MSTTKNDYDILGRGGRSINSKDNQKQEKLDRRCVGGLVEKTLFLGQKQNKVTRIFGSY